MFNGVPEGQYDIYVYLDVNGDNVRVAASDSDSLTTYYVTEQHQFTNSSTFVRHQHRPSLSESDQCH